MKKKNNENNIEKILDKQELKYVLATAVSGKAMYLKKELQQIKYSFVTDITKATKTQSYKYAKMVLDNYIHDTGDAKSELIIVPLLITYELVKEN